MEERIHEVIRARRIEIVGDDGEGSITLRPTNDGAVIAVNGPDDDATWASFVEIVATNNTENQTKTGVHIRNGPGGMSHLDRAELLEGAVDRESLEERVERLEKDIEGLNELIRSVDQSGISARTRR